MLKGYLTRVTYHQVYEYTKIMRLWAAMLKRWLGRRIDRMALPGLLSLPHVRRRALATFARRRRLSGTARKRWVPSRPPTQPPGAARAPSAAGSPLTSKAKSPLLRGATALSQGLAKAAGMSPSQARHAWCFRTSKLFARKACILGLLACPTRLWSVRLGFRTIAMTRRIWRPLPSDEGTPGNVLRAFT